MFEIIHFFIYLFYMQDQNKSELQATVAFDEINKRAQSQPTLVKKVGAVVVFDITKDGKFQQSWSKEFLFY